jgi:hypothetical protein
MQFNYSELLLKKPAVKEHKEEINTANLSQHNIDYSKLTNDDMVTFFDVK